MKTINDLTKAELRVLRLVARGHSNQLIGEKLGITTSTIKAHMMKIFLKLGLKTRVEAVLMYQQESGRVWKLSKAQRKRNVRGSK